jgi:hypothetical protein
MALMTWTGSAKAGVLERVFAAPPASARPEPFWDWMQDLEAMKRRGFSGAMIMLVGAAEAGS